MPYQAKANLSALIESTEDLIWSVDLDYRLIAFNSAFKNHIEGTFGVRPAAGMRPEDFVPKEKVNLMPPLYDRARAEGSFRIEFSLADGRTLELFFNPIVFDGETNGISVFGKDITERKASEKALALLASIIESSDDAIHAVNLDGTVVSWNHGAEVLFGYTAAEIIGKSIAILAPPGRGEEVPRFLEIVAEGGSVSAFDTVLRGKDGRMIEVSLSMSPYKNIAGEIVGASAIARDISQRIRFERDMQEAEEKYRTIFDSALEGIFRTSLESKPLAANPAIARILGYDSPQELLSSVKSIRRDVWFDPEERDRYVQLVKEQGAGQVLGYECRFKRKDGSVVWVSLNSRIVCAADGTPLRNEGFLIDITERKQAEESLRQSGAFLTEAQKIGCLGYYALDIPSKVWTSSEVMNEIFGIDKDFDRTLAGWTALIHPHDRVMMHDYFLNEVVGQRKDFDKEYRIVRVSDQSERWVHGTGRLEFDAQGQPVRMHGIIKDITERKLSEMHLRESEESYRSAFEQAAVGIVHATLEGRILRYNARFAAILGYTTEELTGFNAQQITAPEDRDVSHEAMQRILGGATVKENLEKRYLRKDGSPTWVKLTLSIQRDGEGRALQFIAVVEDINDRKIAEQRLACAMEALRLSEAHYRTVFQTSVDGIAVSQMSDGKYTDANAAFLHLMGYERDEIVGHTSHELNFWADPEDRQEMVAALREHSSFRGMQTRYVRKNGEIIWILVSATLIEIEGVPCILSVIQDISAAKAAEDQIRDLAFYDTLTHLPNRRLLMERLRQSLAARSRTNRKRALLFVDLDNFKTLNDTLGHQTGDLMLQEVAVRLVACIRESDTVARLGGDEFVVMLEDLSDVPEEAAAQAESVGEKILAAIEQPFWLSGRECLSTSSIGITVFGDKRESTDEVLQQADIAMYQAKAAGRNTLRFFAPALQAAVNARAALEEDIRQAIKARQFELYYQPQLDSIGLFGVEALIRWNHPRRGLLFPGEFISLAEETGLILPLGDWVLEKACAQVAAWAGRADTANISIAVNISARQFRQPGFVDKVLAALDRTGANPQNIKLELTESMLVENIEGVIAKMTELKSHGLKFSLDDFGTGYSSLAYLKRLPIDQLKIDSSFVRDIMADAGSRAIAQSVISLGRALGLSVIAECVETEEQRALLSRIGCHAFQGFLFSRPLPLDAFESQWLSSSPFTVPVAGLA
jgi:diguanylate cyclase (GGDEF)-like protein/PAS domain S-box-containing protein